MNGVSVFASWESTGFVETGQLIVDRYRLRDRLGQGGMSVVWRADDELLGREVAVKVLSPAWADNPAQLQQIRAEARAAAGLRHTNIVAVYDYGEVDDGGRTLSFVVMERVDGRSLAELLTGGALPWRLAVLVCAQVAAALASAHAAGVVHRDVKPANVMVAAAGVKLVDFGISAAVGELDGCNGQLLGTPAYLAPERIEGGPVRPATDVYAVGLLLYLCLAGQLPWRTSTVTQMLKAHVHTAPAPLPTVAGLPGEIARLLRRCLAKSPGERPSSAEVAEVLREVAGLPPATLMQSASTPAVVRSRSTSRARRGLIAVGAAAAVTAGYAWWAADPRSEQPSVAALGPACAVEYAQRSVGPGRASTEVVLRNTGAASTSAWRLTLALPEDQTFVRAGSGNWRPSGAQLEASGGQLLAGAVVRTGFDVTYRNPSSMPGPAALNGVPCQASTVRPAAAASPNPTQKVALRRPNSAATAANAPQPHANAKPKPKAKSAGTGEAKGDAKGNGKAKGKSKGTAKSKSKSKAKGKSKAKAKGKSKAKAKGKSKAKAKGKSKSQR